MLAKLPTIGPNFPVYLLRPAAIAHWLPVKIPEELVICKSIASDGVKFCEIGDKVKMVSNVNATKMLQDLTHPSNSLYSEKATSQ